MCSGRTRLNGIFRLQWNPDITKCQGTRLFTSLERGFVINEPQYNEVTEKNEKLRYTRDNYCNVVYYDSYMDMGLFLILYSHIPHSLSDLNIYI